MGILIDFQKAKEALVNPIVQVTPTSNDLIDAISAFTLSQMPKRNRVAIILAEIFGGDPESRLDAADEIIFYADTDFTTPYKIPIKAIDATIGDVVDDSR
jgi:hypothetical protein